MSVYNGMTNLSRTIDCILSQDFTDFEFLIVNDGSKDRSGDILAEYAKRDSRIRVLTQENQGLTKSLIRGCTEARGEYIARQDVGDLSRPERLSCQVEYLDTHQDVVVVCPWFEYRGPNNELVDVVEFPTDPVDMTRRLVKHGLGPLHSGVMYRRAAYLQAGGYRPNFPVAQDIDLWYRMAMYGLIGCIPMTLCEIHLDDSGITAMQSHRQSLMAEVARKCHMARTAGKPEWPILDAAARSDFESLSSAGYSNPRLGRIRANYFIGSQLLKRRDDRCLGYLWRTVVTHPTHIMAWVKLILAVLLTNWIGNHLGINRRRHSPNVVISGDDRS